MLGPAVVSRTVLPQHHHLALDTGVSMPKKTLALSKVYTLLEPHPVALLTTARYGAQSARNRVLQGTSRPLLALQMAYQSCASRCTSSAAVASRRPSMRPVPVIGCGREGCRNSQA